MLLSRMAKEYQGTEIRDESSWVFKKLVSKIVGGLHREVLMTRVRSRCATSGATLWSGSRSYNVGSRWLRGVREALSCDIPHMGIVRFALAVWIGMAFALLLTYLAAVVMTLLVVGIPIGSPGIRPSTGECTVLLGAAFAASLVGGVDRRRAFLQTGGVATRI